VHVIVVGAGLLGVTSAYWLRHAGATVTVIESEPGPALGTSFANGGMLTPSQAMPWNEPGILARVLGSIGRESSPVLLRPHAVARYARWGLAFIRNSSPARYRRNTLANLRLARYSLRLTAELRQELEFDDDAAATGTIKVFRDRHAYATATAWSQVCAEAGLRFEAIDDPQAVVAREPGLEAIATELVGALYFPDDTSADAHRFGAGLAAHARTMGVEFRYGTTVHGLESRSGRFIAAQTDHGRLAADACVLAAASATPALARRLGIYLPVQPVKGYSLTLPLAGWNGAPRIPVVDDEKHIGATRLGERLRIVGTAEFAGADRRLHPGRIDNLVRFVRHTFPAFAARADWSAVDAWCGLRPMSSDGVPIVGATPIEALFLNTGHGHLGWTMCAGSGRLLADLVLGTPAQLDPAPYALARF
jgi:D-amino-acid dehydrogenase